ncbi:DNA-binding response regulator [Enterococcus quebecensis]|uniref:Transcriptional regulator n=1 Tax=Enterococcus quebecensis TaxID=903983 RepID=A0A1E5GTB2_9ENTE|nr:winged helix-turn-helix domain-containing protein [Enterococcus quebecensis]OEG15520.1 transcriptional regulator [Enterococcus quebecensis]OJG73977.1 hypothetical protein RV12_GL000325 [Enterococcus quebecensis]
MFNIALVSSIKDSQSCYVAALKEEKCSIHSLNSDELDASIEKMDAVIITESGLEEIGLTCELIIKVRNLTNRFIWILSHESTKINRIIHLQLGADGTFDNRTESDEFCLYIMNTLERRSNKKKQEVISSNNNHLTSGVESPVISLIPNNFSVNIEGRGEVALTRLEFKVLQLLIHHQGEAISYEELYKNVWGEEKGDKKYRVANLIFHLRKKLEDDSLKPKYIRTIRSRGYMLSS